MKRLTFLILICATPALAQYSLVWGQARSKGFAFYGKPEVIQDACLLWMKANGITRLRRLTVRSETLEIEGDDTAPLVCREIQSHGIPLGESETQVEITTEIQNKYYTYAGNHLRVLTDCARDMKTDAIASLNRLNTVRLTAVSPVTISTEARPFSHTHYGPEICGEIAAMATPTLGPYVQRYLAGSIFEKDFSFYGYKEPFVRACVNFVRTKNLFLVDQVFAGAKRQRFSKPLQRDLVCEALFQLAPTEPDPARRYEVDGSILHHRFYFVGTRSAILSTCDAWVVANHIGTTTAMVLDSERLAYPQPVVGRAICQEIAAAAIEFEDDVSIRYAVGSIRDKGFAMAAPKEELNDRCLLFLKANGIGPTRDFRLGGKDIFLDKPYKNEELCGKIIRRAMKFDEVASGWTFRTKGHIGTTWFTLEGSIKEFTAQCADFFRSNPRIVRVESFFVKDPVTGGERRMNISPPALGAEACFSIAGAATIEEFGKYAFVSGQIGGVGLTIAQNQAVSQLVCRMAIDQAGVTSATQLRVFDRVLDYSSSPLPTSTAICKEFVERGIEFDEYPVFTDPLTGSLTGREFKFQGKLDEVNQQCARLVNETGIQRVEKFMLNGKEYVAPLRTWERFEVCGAILRAALGQI